MRLKITAILAVLLACVALYADPCPYCGEEVVLTKAAPAELPMRVREIWPAGVGPWKYEWVIVNGVRIEMLPWMQANGFTHMQPWSGAYGSRGIPYYFEAKTGTWGLERCKEWVTAKADEPEFIGVNVDCEVPWTDVSTELAQWIHATYPRLKVLSGPLWGLPEPGDPRWANADGVMTFYRVTGKDRFVEDVWWKLGVCEGFGLPYCIGIQPQTSDNPLTFVPADEFKAALDIAAYADGLTLWAADRLWRYSLGLATPVNPEEYDGIMAAIANVNQERRELPRKLVLYPTDTYDNGQPNIPARLNHARCLGRIVGLRGWLPVFTHDADEAEISWDTLDKPDGYERAVALFYDMGHPSRPADIKAQVRAFEATMSEEMR